MDNNEKKFEVPKAELVLFDDVIVTSTFSDPNLDPGGWN